MATVHGDNDVLDDIRTQLKALMDAMMADMVTDGTDPRPATVYNSHEQPYMTFPAVTVGLNEIATDEGVGVSSGGVYTLTRYVECEIRIHTDYTDGYLDDQKCWQLLNSIANYIEQKALLYLQSNLTEFHSLNFTESSIAVGEDFEESLTIGGLYKFEIIVSLQHTPS